MAEYKEARTPRERGKQLHHLEMKEGTDGGHEVEHHFDNDGMTFHKPKPYFFGPDEGHDLVKHLLKHGNIKVAAGVHKALETPSEPESPEEEGHQPAEEEYYVESKGQKG